MTRLLLNKQSQTYNESMLTRVVTKESIIIYIASVGAVLLDELRSEVQELIDKTGTKSDIRRRSFQITFEGKGKRKAYISIKTHS